MQKGIFWVIFATLLQKNTIQYYMKFQLHLLAMLAIVSIIACGKDNTDLTPPTIQELSYTPQAVAAEICGSEEATVFELIGGQDFKYNLQFTDDQALTQYKIDIHNNFDCHGHGGGSAPNIAVPNVDNQTTDWTVLQIFNISGTSATVDERLQVPDNVTAGNYHFHIQVIDESGNDSPFSNFYSMKIKNPEDDIAPTITLDQPASNNNIQIQRGESIRFAGKVTDNRALGLGGNGVLYLAYTDLSSGNTFTSDKAFAFDNNVGTEYNFDFEWTVPQTLVSGNYRLSLGANDGVRNVADFVFFEATIN